MIASGQIEKKIYGCWLGKAIGGTLGCPWEGQEGPLDLDFYRPVPHEPLPNDDLDLQLVWLYHLRESKTTEVRPDVLATAWRRYVDFPMDEYGVCRRNQAYGLEGEQIGHYDNWFSECMGAAIRSEIWACLAPGDPERAAGFAWCDAVCDHCGDGVWAEVFLAALEAQAFLTNDVNCLLDRALSSLPQTSRVWRAVMLTRERWSATGDWAQVRGELLSRFGCANFTDAPMNIAFTILGLLAGEGDFGRSICLAVNCGKDTDCTGATLGALLGIMAPESIPQHWKVPIGDRIVTSPEVSGIEAPKNLGVLTEQVLHLKDQLKECQPGVGAVLERAPAEVKRSPVSIVSQNGVCDSIRAGEDYLLASQSCRQEAVSGGHWRTIQHRGAQAHVSRYEFKLETDGPVLVQAYSPCSKKVWVDGTSLQETESDRCAKTSPAPSFHRGGEGQFQTLWLEKGRHELLVSLFQPRKDHPLCDLVVGIAHPATKQWQPHALDVGLQAPSAELKLSPCPLTS